MRTQNLPHTPRLARLGQWVACLFALCLMPNALQAALEPTGDEAMAYTVSLEAPESHTLAVTLTLKADPEAALTTLRLPAWRPGRYIRQDYAAGLLDVVFTDILGNPLPYRKPASNHWEVQNPEDGGLIRAQYRWRGTVIDAGSCYWGPDLLAFQGVNVLMYSPRLIDEPTRMELLNLPDEWFVSTALAQVAGAPRTWTAPTYHDLIDGPLLSAKTMTAFRFTEGETTYHLHFSGRFGADSAAAAEVLTRDVGAIIRAQKAVFGDSVPFDEYVFQYMLINGHGRHAVEHTYSSFYMLPTSVASSPQALRGLYAITSHEFWHVWNVKRIRPAALWPYDYAEPQTTSLHWFTEGVTEYMSNLMLRRAGLETTQEFLDRMAGSITRLQNHSPALVISPSRASEDSWLYTSPYLAPQVRTSYYLLGERVGFFLDLHLRKLTNGEGGLEDVFRILWEDYYLKGLGVPEEAVQQAAERVAGNDLSVWFASHVHGTMPFDHASLFYPFGLNLSCQHDTAALGSQHLGLRLQPAQAEDGTPHLVVQYVMPASPADEAGLLPGQHIVSTQNGDPVADWTTWNTPKGVDYTKAQAWTVTVRRQDGSTATLTLNYNPAQHAPQTCTLSMQDEEPNTLLKGLLEG